MKSTCLVLLATLALAYGVCPPEFTEVGGMDGLCIHVENTMELSFKDARMYCQDLASEGPGADLLTTPTCDDFNLLADYLEINDPNGPGADSKYYVGVTRATNAWSWITLESCPLGVPFWAYDEGNMEGMDCAYVGQTKHYQLGCSMCDMPRNFICGAPNGPPQPPPVEKEVKAPKCPDGSFNIGEHCYSFNTNEKTWPEAEAACEDEHHAKNGFLFYPDTCDEFSEMIRHIEIEEELVDYWVGASDPTGESWFWSVGTPIEGGVPFWAYDEPDHYDHDEVREHCGAVVADKKYYLGDFHCDEKKAYVCKHHPEE